MIPEVDTSHTPTVMDSSETRRPLLIYDGRCGFCRKWIARWKRVTGDRVRYAPYQDVAQQFPRIPLPVFEQSVQLVDVDDRVYAGAEAVFRVLATVPHHALGLWAYRNVPLFAPIARMAYRWTARHRSGLSAITTLLWGDHVGPSTYVCSRRRFVRAIGMVYLIAFLSLLVQIKGLVGSDGILPVSDFLERTRTVYQTAAQDGRISDARLMYLHHPTLCWINCRNWFLKDVLCGGGALLSALLILGILPGPIALVLWIFYLSLTVAGQTFMYFQWDILLLEVGFLTIFFAPWTWRLRSQRALPPSRAMIFLLHWLLFRLMFLSGVLKLNSGDPSWIRLEALNYHYLTQPLPTWTAWFAHQLPPSIQALACASMFVVELIIPFLYFGPRRAKQLAALATATLMLAIGSTGNYNFFGLATAALCLPLLDDPFWQRLSFRRQPVPVDPPMKRRGAVWVRRICVAPLVFLVLTVSSLQVYASVFQKNGARELEAFAKKRWPQQEKTFDRAGKLLAQTRRYALPFRSINSYGLFRVMTKTRPEIVIEGSNDGQHWKAYEFRWKPGDVSKAPTFVEPHQPRLDWQMWFAALSRSRQWHWFRPMLDKILHGSHDVLALFANNPFPDAPPKFVRALYYDYQFTTFAERRQSGHWWKRTRQGIYARPVTLRP